MFNTVMVAKPVLAAKLGLAVSSARKARSWSQDILAERVEVSKNHIGYIERGEREPSLEVAVRIARVLGLSLDQIFLDARRELEAEKAFASEAYPLFAGISPEMRAPILEMLKAASQVRAATKPPRGRKRAERR